MAKKQGADAQTALRLPTDLLRRADALRPKIVQDPTLAAFGRVTRSTVLKLALARGLDELEKQYR